VGDDLDGVLEVVEDEDRVGEHEQRLGEGLGVGGGDGDARLEVARRLVGEEADGAAGEARQPIFDTGELEPRQLPLDLQQRVFALTRRGVGAGAEDAVGLRADEAVAGEPLSALDGLQEEGVVAAGHLQERRYGRLQVCGDVAVHGRQVDAGLGCLEGLDFGQRRCVDHGSESAFRAYGRAQPSRRWSVPVSVILSDPERAPMA